MTEKNISRRLIIPILLLALLMLSACGGDSRKTRNVIAEGLKCLHGSEGVLKNPQKALECFKTAYEDKSEDGIFLTAYTYDEEIGSYRAAKMYYDMIKNENPYALAYLANMYRDGREVSQDILYANEIWDQAAFSMSDNIDDYEGMVCEAEILNIVGEKFLYGYGGAEKNNEKAMEFFERACDLGCASAYCKLGKMYLEEDGIGFDPAKAKELFEKGVELGNAQAAYELGNMYFQANGVQLDEEKAFRYYKEASRVDHRDAYYALAWMYYSGVGTKQDSEMARKCFKKSADLGNATARNDLTVLFPR